MLALAISLALLVGVSLGLLGGGGSILTVPILRYALGLDAPAAAAGSLVLVGVTSVAALVTHARAGRVRWLTGAMFGGSGMVGAFLAGQLAGQIPPAATMLTLAAMMFGTALAMLRGRRAPPPPDGTPTGRLARVLLQGLLLGALTSFVGAGGGFIVVPALVLLAGLPMEAAVGTALVVISLNAAAALAGYALNPAVAIPWATILPMSAAAIAGSVLGGRLVARVSPDALRRGFAWFVIGMGFFVFGMELPPLLGFAPSALLSGLVSIALTTGSFVLGRRRQVARAAASLTLASAPRP
jgi:uncharacterized membrane protein YfcA